MRLALRVTPSVPEIVTVVFADTTLVFTVKVAPVAPAATVTLAGTAAAVELLESVTTEPPAGAAALNVTVPVEGLPPTTLVGLSDRADSVAAGAGVTVNVALRVVPPNEPEMVAVVELVTDAVVTEKVALVAPAATVTPAGTVAGAVPESVTTAPPVGAAALRVTVPVAVLPPTTLVGFTTSEDSVTGAGAPAGVTVKVAVPSTPP